MTGYHKTRGGQFGLERAGESRFAIEGSAASKRSYSSRTTRHTERIQERHPSGDVMWNPNKYRPRATGVHCSGIRISRLRSFATLTQPAPCEY